MLASVQLASLRFLPALKLPSQFSVQQSQAPCLARTVEWSLLVPPQVWRASSLMFLALLLVRKCQGQVLMVTNTPGLPPSRLFFVTDCHSGLHFLIDTGAEVSVLPVSSLSRPPPPTGHSLQAVNNSSIATFGAKSHTLNLGLSAPSVGLLCCRRPAHHSQGQLSAPFSALGRCHQPPTG